MKPPDSPGSFSETESDVSSVSSFDNAHTPVAATAYPPQPQEASIEADLYQKFSNEAAAAARPTPRGPTWTQRRGPSAILAASATLLALVDVLCCTSPELAKSLFAYSWEYKHDNKKTTVYIGVFARVVGKKTQAIMSGNWGGSTSASYLQTWFFCQLVLLLLTLAASAGVAFAPHPREDATLRQYRHLIRAAILVSYEVNLNVV